MLTPQEGKVHMETRGESIGKNARTALGEGGLLQGEKTASVTIIQTYPGVGRRVSATETQDDL